MTVVKVITQTCPACKGACVNVSAHYINGSAGCMLCGGIGHVVRLGENYYRPATREELGNDRYQ